MLVNSELYLALKEAGASNEKAGAAAAILADHELRFAKFNALHADVMRYIAIISASLVFGALLTHI